MKSLRIYVGLPYLFCGLRDELLQLKHNEINIRIIIPLELGLRVGNMIRSAKLQTSHNGICATDTTNFAQHDVKHD